MAQSMTYLISSLYAKKTINELKENLPNGPITEEEVLDYFEKIASPHIDRSITSKKLSEIVAEEFISNMASRFGALVIVCRYLVHSVTRGSGIWFIRFSTLYKNKYPGALFGVEHMSIKIDNKAKLCNFIKYNCLDHLYSSHAINRMYDRHAGYLERCGTKEYSAFVNSQIFSSSSRILETLEKLPEGQGDIEIPVYGGVFLGERNEDAFVIKTFISTDMLREDQEHLVASPEAFQRHSLDLANGVTLTTERTENLFGKRYTVKKFSCWGASSTGMIRYPTKILR